MRALFIVGRWPVTQTPFELAEKMASNGAGVSFLFIGEACRCAANSDLIDSLRYAKGVYVLEEDFDSHCHFSEGIKKVDYDGWVELLEAYDELVSWT